ncbi:girdin [Diachasma alloeum]|uniref:girdin n=1 Tax=Diachasma alloeum TaxID=454923 RepID=UPI00073811A3|nr:girdin [Diachasma alloeum]
MDSFEVDSNASFDSLHLSSEDFNPPSPYPHSSTPESSKNLQEFEQEAEKLRLALENSRSEIDLLKSSNNALKKKIGELFLEAQASLEDKLRLQNTLKDRECQLAMIENSSRWYQARLHESEAANKSLKMDLEAYQKILHQREQTIADYTDKCEKNRHLKTKFEQLETKYRMECENFQKELHVMKTENSSKNSSRSKPQASSEEKIVLDLRKKIEEMSRDLEIAERRYSNAELSRSLEENSSLSYKKQLEKLRDDFSSLEIEKNEASEKLKVLNAQSEDLRIENERLNLILLSSKKEKVEVEEGIVQLRLQLTKMIAQHKALKSRNLVTERRLGKEMGRVREMEKENRRLKARSVAVNNSLVRKIREEKRRCKVLEGVLREERAKSIVDYQKGETVNSMTICLRQALNREKDLRDRLKLLSKPSDESVDEGYADSAGFSDIPLPSPSPMDSGLMNFAVNVLMRSQNFMAPISSSLSELEMKLERLSATSEPLSIKCR